MFTAHVNDQRTESVAEHSLKVAERAAVYAKKLNLGITAKLQGLFHDLGKMCVDFDNYINGRNSMRRGEIDHAFAGAKYLSELADKTDDDLIKAAAGYISRTIISHHGLHDWLYDDGRSYFEYRISAGKRYDEILENAHNIFTCENVSELLKSAAAEIEEYNKGLKRLSSKNSMKYLFYCGLFERTLQSILIDADFTSTSNFMQNRETERFFDTDKVWKAAGVKLTEKYREFAKKSDKITARRMKISESCLKFADHRVGICRLIVPTGGGKTLSSLRFAVEQCKRFGKERIFYVAPFMSILEQNSDVIREIVGEENFLEHYSDFAQSFDDKEELSEYELRTDKWDSPVISTTLVQFLNSIFSNKTASVRRFHRLANSVIIIDEVQAIPIKCVNLFNLAMNYISSICGATVILCTATQPCFNNTAFPIEFDEDMEMNPDFKEDFIHFHRTELISAFRAEQYTYEETADFCAQRFDENGNILIVVNTKKSAAAIYGLLSEKYQNTDTEIIHLSTGMCPQHRRDAINNIKQKLKDEKPIICVTTQLIEAGVDISFKCVVRSLAGLDNAAQAAGRCNRNGEYPLCSSYIINIMDEKLNNLHEIEQRQKAAKSVILGGNYSDYLDAAAMDEYFMRFYHDQKGELSFSVELDGFGTTLVDILCTNIQRNKTAKKLKPSERIGTHLLKTAGEKFNVIDNNTEAVLVPYNEEAERMIADLNSEISNSDVADILRRSQKFSVSLYSNQIDRLLENGALYKTKCGVWALVSAAYDCKGIGLMEKTAALDNLIY